MSMKNDNDNIGNRTRSLLVCSAVPQPTAKKFSVFYIDLFFKKNTWRLFMWFVVIYWKFIISSSCVFVYSLDLVLPLLRALCPGRYAVFLSPVPRFPLCDVVTSHRPFPTACNVMVLIATCFRVVARFPWKRELRRIRTSECGSHLVFCSKCCLRT
jgi:hypothetical protein